MTASRIRLSHLDALEFSRQVVAKLGNNSFAFYDPPYIDNGEKLYLNDYSLANHQCIEQHVSKPVVGYVAGFTAPEGKTMGHAGAIISGSAGTAQAKKEALEKAGVRVGKTPSETAALIRDLMKRT